MSCRFNAPFASHSLLPVLILAVLILIGAFAPHLSLSETTPDDRPSVPLPFVNGERLSYDVTWLGMRAGIATTKIVRYDSSIVTPSADMKA